MSGEMTEEELVENFSTEDKVAYLIGAVHGLETRISGLQTRIETLEKHAMPLPKGRKWPEIEEIVDNLAVGKTVSHECGNEADAKRVQSKVAQYSSRQHPGRNYRTIRLDTSIVIARASDDEPKEKTD